MLDDVQQDAELPERVMEGDGGWWREREKERERESTIFGCWHWEGSFLTILGSPDPWLVFAVYDPESLER